MSSTAQWQTIKRILDEALELPREQWPDFLARRCGDDAALREHVAAFLEQYDDEFMSSPVVMPLGGRTSPSLIGATLGRYRIVRALGAGGMGEVFEAEQLEPFPRTVALKLMRHGAVSREVMARFDSEQRALAMMNHPNIAQVFDAGWSDDGRPYFVMEFVAGERITEASDTAGLGVSDRVSLFAQVCDGVQHAHHKGIIHRDLKPSNVLVSGHGSERTVKIIDFGVAKGARPIAQAVSSAGTDPGPGHTRVGAWIGTSGYVSPEQARGDADIDTRSDVYALGALLYELLSGTPAFDEQALAGLSLAQRRKIICEQLPPLPSERPGGGAALRGDLDSIVCKAMAKNRDERYATVSEFAADLRRHLQHEPVSAADGGALYRLGKLFRRRVLAVAAGVFAVVVLLAGAIAAGVGYIEAVRAQNEAAVEAQRANEEADKARQVADFLAELFRVSDPGQGAGESITAREILDRGAARLTTELQTQPAVHAMLIDTIGVVYTNLGIYEEAARYLSEGLAQREEVYGEKHLETAASLNHLGKLNYFRGDFDSARGYYERALAVNLALRGERDAAVGDSRNNLGELAVAKGDFDVAIDQHKEALAIRREVYGESHRDVGMSLNNLAGALRRSGDLQGAEAKYREAIAVNRVALGAANPEVATNLSNLGVFLMTTGRYEEAADLHEEALAVRRKALAADHPHIANSLHNLGSLRVHLGRYDDAEPLVVESLDMHLAIHGHNHPLVALSLNNLGVVRQNQERHDEAIERFDEALDIFRSTVGDAHPYVGICATNRARSLNGLRRFDEAASVAGEAREALIAALKPDHWRVAVAKSVLGEALAGLGRTGEAEILIEESLARLLEVQGEETPYVRAARRRLDSIRAAPARGDQ